MKFFLLFVIFSLFVSCQNFRGNRLPSSLNEEGCSELLRKSLGLDNVALLKKMDSNAIIDIEPTFFGNFLAYARKSSNEKQVIVRRLTDGKIIHQGPMKNKEGKAIYFDSKKGRLFQRLENGQLLKIKGFSIKPIKRDAVSYDEVLEIMKRNPYEIQRLPTIPLQMFRFFKDRIVDFFVGRRSVDILTRTSDYRQMGMNKPIHPMGIGVEGVMSFKKTRFSGAFSGGSFPMLGRLSISQGNPSKFKKRTWFEALSGRPARAENRSVAAAFKLFPTQDKKEKVITANAVFQNDLNGEKLDNYVDGVMTNQPRLNFLKIRKLYEVFTLIGVAKGALSSPNDLKASFPYMNPQLRPLHQYAEMGVEDPADVVVPKWIKIQTVEDQTVFKSDDFRVELDETIKGNGLKYKVYLADSTDENDQIIWEEAGMIDINKSILSEAVDKNLLFFHDGLRSPFTGEMIDNDVVPIPVRE